PAKGGGGGQDDLENMIKKALDQQGMAKGMKRLVGDELFGGDFPVAAAPDGKRVAARKDGTICVWETATGKRLHELKPQAPAQIPAGAKRVLIGGLTQPALTFSADGKQLFVAGLDGVQAFDLTTGKSVAPPGKAGDLPGGASTVSPDGRYAALQEFEPQQQSGTLKVRDLQTGKDVAELKTDVGGARDLQFAPDGKTLA